MDRRVNAAVLLVATLLWAACDEQQGSHTDAAPDSHHQREAGSGDGARPDGGVGADSAQADSAPADQRVLDFSALQAALAQALSEGRITGAFALLDLYDATSGALIFSHLEGQGGRSTLLAVASASKWVTSTVLLQLVAEGQLSLGDTTAQHLGWSGTAGSITLEQLLNFTSGVPGHLCAYQQGTTLAACVELIGQSQLQNDPGAAFYYNQSHLHVAGRMAEVVTGKSWPQLFAERIVAHLGLDPETAYYAQPDKRAGTDNPLLAGGLVISAADYGTFLTHLLGAKGAAPLIPPAELAEQHAERWPPGFPVSYSPISDMHYGLGCWRHCVTPEDTVSCDAELVVHSAGAYGFVPFWDKRYGVYGVLGAAGSMGSGEPNATLLYEELRPLIAAALGE